MMTVVNARFQTRQQYYIVGIGLILTGKITMGSVEYGNQIRLTIDGAKVIYTITDVETIEYMTAGTTETALILELSKGDKEVNYLERIAGQEIEISTG